MAVENLPVGTYIFWLRGEDQPLKYTETLLCIPPSTQANNPEYSTQQRYRRKITYSGTRVCRWIFVAKVCSQDTWKNTFFIEHRKYLIITWYLSAQHSPANKKDKELLFFFQNKCKMICEPTTFAMFNLFVYTLQRCSESKRELVPRRPNRWRHTLQTYERLRIIQRQKKTETWNSAVRFRTLYPQHTVKLEELWRICFSDPGFWRWAKIHGAKDSTKKSSFSKIQASFTRDTGSKNFFNDSKY